MILALATSSRRRTRKNEGTSLAIADEEIWVGLDEAKLCFRETWLRLEETGEVLDEFRVALGEIWVLFCGTLVGLRETWVEQCEALIELCETLVGLGKTWVTFAGPP